MRDFKTNHIPALLQDSVFFQGPYHNFTYVSGKISQSVKESHNHANVAVYTSSKDHEYSFSEDFSSAWFNANHSNECMRDVYRVSLS